MDKVFELESYQNFEHVLQFIIANLSYSTRKLDETHNQIQQSDLMAAEDELRNLISSSNFDMEKVGETLSNKAWDRERLKYFLSLLENEKSKLLYGSLIHYNRGFGETIIHSDWFLKLVLGTSELNTMQQPILQLILSTVNTSGVKCNKMIELDKNMVLKTIELLEKITGTD